MSIAKRRNKTKNKTKKESDAREMKRQTETEKKRKKRKDSGISKTITVEKSRKLMKLLKNNPGYGTRQARAAEGVSRPSIQRWLSTRKWGKSWKPEIVPIISEKNAGDRKEFASKVVELADELGDLELVKRLVAVDEMPAK